MWPFGGKEVGCDHPGGDAVCGKEFCATDAIAVRDATAPYLPKVSREKRWTSSVSAVSVGNRSIELAP